MALIKCPECGKEFSERAAACPVCGFPTNEIITNTPIGDTCDIAGSEESLSTKLWNAAQSGIQSAVETHSNAYKATRQIGPVQIDEVHSALRIHGAVPVNGKKDGIGKTFFKGTLALSTMGMSLAAEKLIGGNKQKVGSKEWLDFSDLLNYDLLEDESLVTSGGVGQALIGGALFGGAGAIAGGITSKRSQKKKIESLIIKITTNSFSYPCYMIPLITKPTKIDSKEYKNAFTLAHQILSALDVITHRQ